jgi:hypothetical protein
MVSKRNPHVRKRLLSLLGACLLFLTFGASGIACSCNCCKSNGSASWCYGFTATIIGSGIADITYTLDSETPNSAQTGQADGHWTFS